eukprot:TRINITY_DN1341_c0_g1_i1.p1 TRINITY_DN1341_c0_g1~~TRINITY_DN1341_c0_g1_i1.p1  ORF type:complete len:595 (+),score=84.70 TRINITY_DN1341_c0_g1_i1:38-1822(+)
MSKQGQKRVLTLDAFIVKRPKPNPGGATGPAFVALHPPKQGSSPTVSAQATARTNGDTCAATPTSSSAHPAASCSPKPKPKPQPKPVPETQPKPTPLPTVKPATPASAPVGATRFIKGWDMWDEHHVKLPCSTKNVIYEAGKASKWRAIEGILGRHLACVQDLEECILQINPSYRGKWDFSGLREFVEKRMQAEERVELFATALPAMQSAVLNTQHLFTEPIPLLVAGKEREVVFTQQQVYCLLSNAFFCTFPHRNQQQGKGPTARKTEYGNFPSINFSGLFRAQYLTISGQANPSHGACAPAQEAKLRCLFSWFQQQASRGTDHTLSIRRVVGARVDWEGCSRQLAKLTCSTEGSIEDADPSLVHVDFANKFLGGGILGKGCVQEEIMMAQFPEMIVARLVTEALEDNEAIIFTGVERFSAVSGYGDKVEFRGPVTDRSRVESNIRQRTICAVDAFDFSQPDTTIEEQFSPRYLNRELGKAYTGFSAASVNASSQGLATGNWGCGAFKGDRELKALLQLCASSAAGYMQLLYYTFGDEPFALGFVELHQRLCRARVTVGQLYMWLADLYSARKTQAPPPTAFAHVASYLRGFE